MADPTTPVPPAQQDVPAATSDGESLQDPAFRRGVVSLLAALAYGELVSFFTVVGDADAAPTLQHSVQITRMAVREFGHFDLLSDRIVELGADPHEAMTTFREPLDEWHRRCAPADWLEGLMKVYAGSSIAVDFYREIVPFVDPQTQALVQRVLADAGHYDYAEQELRTAIDADPKVAARMALWGRRIVGEALTQSQRAAAENDDLVALLVDGESGRGMDLAGLTNLFGRITDKHRRRMEALGLTP